MRQFVEQWHGGKVECVSCCRLKGSDSTLTENDVRITVGHDIFGREQELLDRRRESALEQYGLSRLPDGLQ